MSDLFTPYNNFINDLKNTQKHFVRKDSRLFSLNIDGFTTVSYHNSSSHKGVQTEKKSVHQPCLLIFLNLSSYPTQKFSDDFCLGLKHCSGEASPRVSRQMKSFDREAIQSIYKCASHLLIRLVIIPKLQQLQWSHFYRMNQFRSATEKLSIAAERALKIGHALIILLATEIKAAVNSVASDLISKSILMCKTASHFTIIYGYIYNRTSHYILH